MIHLLIAFRLATADTAAEPGAERIAEQMAEAVELAQPQWIRYRVSAGEHLVDVAGRFGVDVDDLIEWNGLAPGSHRVHGGKRLKIHARRDPPPRQRSTHVVEKGDTWQSIAIAHGIDSRKLRAYNWKKKKLRRGQELTIWTDPGQPATLARTDLEPVVAPEIPDHGRSRGRPQVGRIRKSVKLPESELYVRARPGWSWGSSHTLEHLIAAIATLHNERGYGGAVVIGSISKKGGGPFPPHNSHQSGRDVDIRLPVRPGVGIDAPPRANEVDWEATWALIDSLIATEQVQVIFLEDKLQRRLYEAARRTGVPHERLRDVIHHADDRRWSHALVRHAHGHDGHIHVRFRCAPDEKRCKP